MVRYKLWYSTDCAVKNCRPVMHDTFSCKTKGVGPSTTLAWPGWKQPDIPVEVDLVVNSRMLLKRPKREIFVAGIFAQIRPIWIVT